jgi:hypothetical protein
MMLAYVVSRLRRLWQNKLGWGWDKNSGHPPFSLPHPRGARLFSNPNDIATIVQ